MGSSDFGSRIHPGDMARACRVHEVTRDNVVGIVVDIANARSTLYCSLAALGR
jgi:hypothetical protein